MLLAIALALAVQDPDTVTLPPVTVTGARRVTGTLDVPAALTELKPADFFGQVGHGLDAALALVPGVVAQSRAGGTDVRITIRGYGARGAGERSNAGTTRGIRVLVDGFPETEPDGRTALDGIDLAAAHGIEVVRSNASAVWGNAAGGVVSVTTLPDPDGPPRFASVDPMAGGFGLRRLAVRGGLTGRSRLGATFVHTEFAGWREHSASRRSLLNVAFRTPAAAGTSVGIYAVGSDNYFRIPGPLTATQLAANPRQANPLHVMRNERRHNRVARLGVSVDHQFGTRAGVAALAYVNPKVLQRSERGTYRDFTRYHLGGSAVLRVATALGGAPGTLLVGTDHAYQDGAILFYSLTSTGGRGETPRANKREAARNAGVFVAHEIALQGGAIRLSVGARYDAITYTYQDFLNPDLDARKTFHGVTPKLGVAVHAGPTHTVYASVGGGVEAPAGNETDPAPTFGQDTVTGINPLLDPIRSITYEVGTKQRITFGAGSVVQELSYDLALYHTAVRNEIVPYQGGRFHLSAGRVRRRGAELGLRLVAAGGLSVGAALAVTDHRYTRYVVDSVYYDQPGAFADYAGNRVVGVPTLTDAITLDVAPRVLGPLRLRLAVQGMGAFYADDANQVKVPGYRIAALTVGIDEPVELFVTVNNLFDRRYVASAYLNPEIDVGGEAVAFEPGLPRHVVIGASLSAR
ncbi:MAG: TonB-dependent receptor family protein [Gemmatimonadales bacterium]